MENFDTEEWVCCGCGQKYNTRKENLKYCTVAVIGNSVYLLSELTDEQKKDESIEKYEAPCCKICGDLLAPVIMLKAAYEGEQSNGILHSNQKENSE